jgi:hypothetical protein
MIAWGALMTTYDVTKHVIHTRADGVLDGTTPDQVAALARAAASADRVVIHFHGGLVSSERGFETAERLAAEYQRAAAYPVFFVWSSGLVEIVTGNLREILGEELCQQLLRWVLRFTVGKLGQTGAQRAAGVLTLPYEMEVNAELQRRGRGDEPYAATRPRGEVEPVDDLEREQLEQALSDDAGLAAGLEAVLASRHPERQRTGARGIPVERRASARTLMSPETLAEIDPGAAGGRRGILGTALLAKKVGTVFAAVVRRFRDGTDHGVYPTVVEELLRELYVANVGGAIWAAMKKDTADTFATDGEPRGGALFLKEFRTDHPDVTLVGHSTGAVFSDNYLAAMPAGAKPVKVVLLAPACTFEHLAQGLAHRDLVERFRLFTMADSAEQEDHLVPGLYPRSLLYLVSGLLERDGSGRSAHVPVVGMQRYYDTRFARLDGVQVVQEYLAAERDRLVLSPTPADAVAGLRAAALHHGAFDEDAEVLASIRKLVAG